ncbi:aspartate/glutamate racemase family protein [Psychrosphaera sp. B3R10]|uniref:aspartate/glutamate racemase family protein n=1 Tax=unclassified Psychrosphaera TaxID=2641570 RepID=UPI001C095BF3|nr:MULTISPECIES: aspartate/glutamate racemase family protein [unclassified Psychrosphaera]MBU2883282.1 aspartate/glutamate racemase family protein [Psychrosphaera sp. I2R16]MBU2990624.1 aspartate/glutamate racemase family protein [Psychrosphaera sp. B3R10]
MKTIGILGGMSWESTVGYYQRINRGIQAKLGGLHSAKVLINSVDFAEYETLQHHGDWAEIARLLTTAAQQLERAGADMILIATNTMHLVAEQIQSQLQIPLLHIADATGDAIVAKKLDRVALLGTAFTMEKPFYKAKLTDQFGLQVDIPPSDQRKKIHDIIYKELCRGEINETSRLYYLDVIADLEQQGAQGVILGCTEIGLLVSQQDCNIEVFDTTQIHAEAAVNWALANELLP